MHPLPSDACPVAEASASNPLRCHKLVVTSLVDFHQFIAVEIMAFLDKGVPFRIGKAIDDEIAHGAFDVTTKISVDLGKALVGSLLTTSCFRQSCVLRY